MTGIKKFTFDVTSIAQRDFIYKKGLEHEYHTYLGKILLKIKKGEISLDEYRKSVSQKILKG